ncbi:MAG: DUF2490 domain-containing protein [Cyclobacteriaceae bacterium]
MNNRLASSILLIVCLSTLSRSQVFQLPPEKETRTTSGVWLGIYTKYHFNDRWAYYGEYHVRRRDGINDMAQIYLRFGATYKVAKYLDVTAGFVNPYYWAPNQEDPNVDKIVPQYRTWEQAVLATPFEHIKVFHQLRMEQRFKRDYEKGSSFKLTHRFRYKLTTYIPLNHKDFTPKTLFLSLYNEIFIQAGKSVVYNHLEDNRAFIGLGYNLSHDLQIQSGYMYTFRHDGAPHKYEHRNIFRFSVYHHMDLHRKENRIPDVPIH